RAAHPHLRGRRQAAAFARAGRLPRLPARGRGRAAHPHDALRVSDFPGAAGAPGLSRLSNSQTEQFQMSLLAMVLMAAAIEPKQFEPVVGDWHEGEVDGHKGLYVDGSKWRQGKPSANLADQARRLYGERYAEFLDGVKAFAYFPLAVYKGDCPSGDLALSVRFYPQAGRIDQGAGLAWSIAPDGSYLAARANALEDNLLFFRVVRGKRTILETVRGVDTPSRTWHRLAVTLRGRSLSVELDGKERLKRDLDAPPSGRCGLWSKADSQVLFDDFAVGEP